MSGLVLKLAPRERVLVNGAVIENGDRRCRFSILSPNANVLRLKDAIHPSEATTPIRRLCYMAQLVLSGDAETPDTSQSLLRRIEEMSRVLTDPDSQRHLAQATQAILDQRFYHCLKSLRALIAREDRLLATRLDQ